MKLSAWSVYGAHQFHIHEIADRSLLPRPGPTLVTVQPDGGVGPLPPGRRIHRVRRYVRQLACGRLPLSPFIGASSLSSRNSAGALERASHHTPGSSTCVSLDPATLFCTAEAVCREARRARHGPPALEKSCLCQRKAVVALCQRDGRNLLYRSTTASCCAWMARSPKSFSAIMHARSNSNR